jgi:selenocysteine-specific elongation factor
VRSIVIGTAGHIDHGKSALVRALTGTDPDRLKEEKARGITIDLGFAHLFEDGMNLAFVDVPGHERFVKNMLAGAGGIDLVMLVVAADESVMPQTREHFHICRLLHVRSGLVVLTKTDLSDAETLELARLDVRELVAGSFLADAPVVAVSSRTGEGLEALTTALVSMAASLPTRSPDGPVRLPIDRVFSMKGFGTVATGTLVSGCLREHTDLVVLPAGREVKVRGLQVHGRREPFAEAGRRVAVNLAGVDVDDLSRGDTIVDIGAFDPTRRLDAVLELVPGAVLRHGARVRFHCGTSELLGRVALAGRAPDAPLPHAEPGATPSPLYARIRLESAAIVTRGDRFILRAYSPAMTIGGGVVLDPRPAAGPIRSASALARFERLHPERAAGDAAAAAFVDERAGFGLERRDLTSRAGLPRSAADKAVERMLTAGSAVLVADVLLAPRVVTELSDRLLRELKNHHAAQPLAEGVPREEARERVFRRTHPLVFDGIVDRLVSEGRLVARDRLALPGHQVSLTPEEEAVQSAVARIYRDARLSPPDAAAVAQAAGAPDAVVARVVSLLLRKRALVKIERLVFDAAAIEALKTEIRGLKGREGARVDVTSFKERYGITRKYAIPLLEYLDRERVTRRVGETRTVL